MALWEQGWLRSWAGEEGLEKTGCQVCCGQAATGLLRSGCWGIRVCLAPPAPTSAGKSLTRLRGCRQPRSHMHDHHLGPAPNAFLSISQNNGENKFIKNSIYEWKKCMEDRVGGHIRVLGWSQFLFQKPHPSPGPHWMESSILYKQVNLEMKEDGIM